MSADARAVAAEAGDRRDPRAQGAGRRRRGAARREPIAIVGMGLRFPGGADDPESFWQLLVDGVDAISEVPPERWAIDDLLRPRSRRAGADGDALRRLPRRRRPVRRRSSSASRRARPRAWIRSSGCCSRSPGRRSSTPASPTDRLVGSRTGVFVGITNDATTSACCSRTATRSTPTRRRATRLASRAGRLVLRARLRRAQRGDRHRLLVVAGRRAPRRAEPAQRRVRPGAGRRRQPDPGARADDQLLAGPHDGARRPLQDVRRGGRRLRARRGLRHRRAQAALRRRWPTATASSPSSAARRSTRTGAAAA